MNIAHELFVALQDMPHDCTVIRADETYGVLDNTYGYTVVNTYDGVGLAANVVDTLGEPAGPAVFWKIIARTEDIMPAIVEARRAVREHTMSFI